MSTIERHFNRTVVILRIKSDSGYKKSFASTGTADVHLQRLDEQASSQVMGVYGATHRAWIGIDEDIKEGDQVRDDLNNLFTVISVTDDGRDFAINEHKEVLLKIYSRDNLPRV
jgi:hypothetical protein